jgi:hypothetical protein
MYLIAGLIAEALSTGFCPAGLQLDLSDNEITARVLNQIRKLLEINEKKQAAISWAAFHHGLRPLHPPTEKNTGCACPAYFQFFGASCCRKKAGTFFHTGQT